VVHRLLRTARFFERVCGAALCAALAAPVLAAPPVVMPDPVGDAIVRRTDLGNDAAINPALHRLPDIVEMRIGRFAPSAPHLNLFAGAWSAGGGFLRFEMVLAGLINPPGPMDYGFKTPEYEPFEYGANPVFGFVEFDVDHDISTGGELNNPELRFDGGVGRFGGKPVGAEFADRIAYDASAFDHDLSTPPHCDRSGEEFHLVFRGEDIQSIDRYDENPAGDYSTFDPGERWTLHGPMFHRAHGFEMFAFQCVGQEGRYLPNVSVEFRHNLALNQTTISLVYPLTNAASALMQGPGTPVQPNDGCPGNQNSIEEALLDLQFSAMFASPPDRLLPEFALIAGWENQNISARLDPAGWRVDAMVGTGYCAPEPDGARYGWTDTWPNCRVGDFNGDGVVDSADAAMLSAYIAKWDGVNGVDADGVVNGRVVLIGFAANFSMFDTNYDGVVEAADTIVLGDMNINLVADSSDLSDFVLALVNPDVYTATHGGESPLLRGDLNGDHKLDGADILLMLGIIGCH